MLFAKRPPDKPSVRELRVYAFDPSLSGRLDTWEINEVVLPVRWEGAAEDEECSAGDEPDLNCLRPGPIGEYLEVLDLDPASGCVYAPVDLNHRHILAQKGVDPSEGVPQFHQQMVYAVAMSTIEHFERALGRPSLWAPRDWKQRPADIKGDAAIRWEFVRRLRIHPHALREANAYYSPEKKALLFGYFPGPDTPDAEGALLPGGIIFTCLSHDIIAHETTHALLDGMHRRLIEPVNPDTLAFHEAFADIVALFQHFSLPGVLRHQIAKTRGDLRAQNLLGELAQEFGHGTGGRGALRSALGAFNKEKNKWEAATPDPTLIEKTWEPHKRGSILVAAVFDAFLSIYQARVADLFRLATNGTGVLPEGELQTDLVNRLSAEAAKAAGHMLRMCIRALDYLPPVDVDFGAYLQALITSDYDLVRRDERGYRVAVIQGFRRWGIFPRSLRTLSESSLRWECLTARAGKPVRLEGAPIKNFAQRPHQRRELHFRASKRAEVFHEWLEDQSAEVLKSFGLIKERPLEVHSVRLGKRAGPNGEMVTNVVIQVTQSRPGFLDPERQKTADAAGDENGDFKFRGGCTLIVDPDTLEILYCIAKRVDNDGRLKRQRRYLSGDLQGSLRATYFGESLNEPFAMLHRCGPDEV